MCKVVVCHLNDLFYPIFSLAFNNRETLSAATEAMADEEENERFMEERWGLEVDRLKEAINNKVDESGPSANNLKKILSKMDSYNTRALDGSLVSEIVKIQSLVREINK